MTNRWMSWLAGIALVQLLVIGVDVAMLWPSEAEQAAALLKEGMTENQLLEIVVRDGHTASMKNLVADCNYFFDDGSWLTVTFAGSVTVLESGLAKEEWRVRAFQAMPAIPVHPLIRLRRTLARLIPALQE